MRCACDLIDEWQPDVRARVPNYEVQSQKVRAGEIREERRGRREEAQVADLMILTSAWKASSCFAVMRRLLTGTLTATSMARQEPSHTVPNAPACRSVRCTIGCLEVRIEGARVGSGVFRDQVHGGRAVDSVTAEQERRTLAEHIVQLDLVGLDFGRTERLQRRVGRRLLLCGVVLCGRRQWRGAETFGHRVHAAEIRRAHRRDQGIPGGGSRGRSGQWKAHHSSHGSAAARARHRASRRGFRRFPTATGESLIRDTTRGSGGALYWRAQ